MKSLADVIYRNGWLHGDRIAVIDGERKITHRELATRATRLAGALGSRYDLTSQDRVVMLSRNRLEMIEALAASGIGGCVLVPLNWRLAAAELAGVIADAEPKVAFVEAGFSKLWLEIAERIGYDIPIVWIDGHAKPQLVEFTEDANVAFPKCSVSADDLVHIIYTSGTTGKPKGAMLSQEGMIAGAKQVSAFSGLRPSDRIVVAMPLFHVGGIIEWYATQYLGGSCVILSHFDPEAFSSSVERWHATIAHLAPVMVKSLIEAPKALDHNLSSLRRIHYGSAPVPPEDLRRAYRAVGPILNQLYGMTECTTISMLDACQQEPDGSTPAQRRLASAGHAYPEAEVWIQGENGEVCSVGEIGEVIVRSTAQFVGYWRNPEATAATLVDGAVRTGDLGLFDEDGYLYIVDRAKDVIVSGGENIYSREVEDALMAHEAVAEAAVISAPDQKWGEAIVAHVVLKSGKLADEAMLIAHCRTLIAGYKRPRQIEIVASLPRLPHGKVDKKRLREPYWRGRDRMVS